MANKKDIATCYKVQKITESIAKKLQHKCSIGKKLTTKDTILNVDGLPSKAHAMCLIEAIVAKCIQENWICFDDLID